MATFSSLSCLTLRRTRAAVAVILFALLAYEFTQVGRVLTKEDAIQDSEGGRERRAGFAIRREMAGSGVDVEMHATRYEKVDPDHWWTTRSDLQWVIDEGAKLIAYELGLGA